MSKRIQVSIDGIICLADPIQTADIRTGDTLIHIWNDPKSFGEVSLLTVSKADHFKNGIWFSNKKVNAMQDEEGYYITGIDKKDRSDPLGFAIATQSHDSLPNHAFYKAVTL